MKLQNPSKKGMGPETLVIIASLLATAAVFLLILYPQWKGVAEGSAESSAECSSELLLRSMVKKVSFGYSDIPVKCEVKKRTVTQKDIEKLMPLAKQATQIYEQQLSTPTTFSMIRSVKEVYPNDNLGQRNWALSKIVADEIISCHKKGWEGKISLEQTGLLELFPEVGNMCLYCTKINYDTELNEAKLFLNLGPWLKNNIINQKTYSDYLYSSVDSVKPGLLGIMARDDFVEGMADRVLIDTSNPTAVLLVMSKSGHSYVMTRSLSPGKKDFTEGLCKKIIGDV